MPPPAGPNRADDVVRGSGSVQAHAPPLGPNRADDVVRGSGSVQAHASLPPEQDIQECTYCSSLGVGYEHPSRCSCCKKINIVFLLQHLHKLGP